MTAEIGVIGGTGLYELIVKGQLEQYEVKTPYGPPSDPLTLASVGGRRVAFLPRHGRDHRHPPPRINSRANLWALRSVGVRQILAPCAAGSLRTELGPGSFVLPDQVIDRTSGRSRTYFDSGAVHVSFADPYCPEGRSTVAAAAKTLDVTVTETATMVVVEGPRFSTRAESQWYSALGGSVVNMTGLPEAALARELALCYTTVALVTDIDAGIEAGEAVGQEEVFRVFGKNLARLRELLFSAIALLPDERRCPCPTALDGIDLPWELP